MLLINNLSARIAAHRERINAAIERVVASGWLVLGEEGRQFEQAFAKYLGASRCVGLANGTEAIELALRALNVGTGDRVATAANAGSYSCTAILAAGAVPWFMDVDLSTQCATLTEVKSAVAAGAKAVIVTHLYGRTVPEIAAIAGFCLQHGVLLLEDCAQAHGARLGSKFAGTFGDAASFSFYPTKNLGALGDGGAVVTNRPQIAERVALLRQYGWTAKYRIEISGARNSRLDELQAALLLEFLPHLDAANARRREIARRYNTGIVHRFVVPPKSGGEDYICHLYVVRSPARDALRDHLRALGIATEVHYPIPDHRQPAFGRQFDNIRLPNTETLVGEILTLPCYPEMNDAQIARVIEGVNSWRS